MDPLTLFTEPKRRAVVLQALVVVLLVALLLAIIHNASINLAKQNIASGFGFLNRTAGFDISQHLIAYKNTDTYARAFWVGLCNTLLVAALGILFATAFGFLLGIARLSSNWLVAKLALVYVEVVRNVPLLLWLFVIYFGVLLRLPSVAESWNLPGGLLLNQRGLYAPSPWGTPAWPVIGAHNVEGGIGIEPELIALLCGLVSYTSAYIGEIVRGGIESVSRGQRQAASALGLNESQAMRHVILPQALRAIVPPLTNQYVNLAKNSSLAVAVGYPDLVSVFAGTILNHTNQAVETIAITMAVYLALSLSISAAMNVLDARVALKER